MNYQTHYPEFDVMREAAEWDDHTREIVKKRLESGPDPDHLSPDEAQTIAAIAAALTDDDRSEIVRFILKHLDDSLQRKYGEDQRKTTTPPEAALIRSGLIAIEATARNEYGRSFPGLTLAQRQSLLGRVERNELPAVGPWSGMPQPELFQKLLERIVEAYYSHPAVWSEIGYAGPAYPRGYVRIELDLTDPWEPRQDAKHP